MSTLYLTTPGATLKARSQQLEVRADGQLRQRVPARLLTRVLVLAPTHLTSNALTLCARMGVELVVASRGLDVAVRFATSETGLALRAAQFARLQDEAWKLAFSRAVVAGKIRNQRRFLARSGAAREPEVRQSRDELTVALDRTERVVSPGELLGVEGSASAAYFRGWGSLINPEFGFKGRNRRPPRDAANALLSFVYTLVTAEALAACLAAGLEPAIGYLHQPHRGRPALALDLVEEFRAPVGDALVVQLTGWRVVRPSDFRSGERGVRMSPRARRRVLELYEEKLGKPFRNGESMSTLRDVLRVQAVRLADTIVNGAEYRPFSLP